MSIQVRTTSGSPQLQSKTVTPSSITQYVTPSVGYDGLSQVIINGDSNFISENIKSGVKIWDVLGNYERKSIQIKTYTTYFIETVIESSKSYFYYTMPLDLNTQLANEGLFAVSFDFSSLGEYGTNSSKISLHFTAWNPTNITLRRWGYNNGYMYYSTNGMFWTGLSRCGFINNDYTKFTFQRPNNSQDIFQYISEGSINVTESSSVHSVFCYLN